MKPIAITLLLLLCLQTSFSQEAEQPAAKPQFKLGINYNTGINYFGRTDSLRSSAFFPLAELWVTPQFYMNAAPIFVNNAVQSMEYSGTVATVGYQHVSDNWITGLYALKPFYKESSKLVQSALKAQTGFNLSYLNPVLNLNGGADVKFSDGTDFGATAGVDHLVRLPQANDGVLIFDPSLYVYAGTQRFQQTYYKEKKGLLFLPGNRQAVTEDVQKFNVLAYEASLPIIYSKGKLMLMATPSYIMPQNLVKVENRPDLSEQGKDMFYATVGVKYTF